MASLYSPGEKALVLGTGPSTVVLLALGAQALPGNFGLDKDVALAIAQILPALLIALVFSSSVFGSSKKKERKNLSWGAVSVLVVGAIGELACFAMLGRDRYDDFFASLTVASGLILLLWLCLSPLIAAER
jgi:hypothetical protein